MRTSLCSVLRRVSRPRPAARRRAPECRLGFEALDGRTLLSGVSSLNIIASASLNNSFLNGVAEIASNDVWAVGTLFKSTADVKQTLTDQWNGTSWSVITSPNVTATGNDSLHGVTANPSNGDVVAVGQAPLSNGQENGLVLANNEPPGSTPLSPAPAPSPTPSPGNGTTDVVGTFGDLMPGQRKEAHKLW